MPMPRSSSRAKSYLLDTHAWIWIVNQEDRLRRSKVLPDILRASAVGRVAVSAISIWEISLLARKGRLSFAEGVRRWVNTALEDDTIIVAPLSPEIALRCNELPGEFHGDPADRILVATAAVMHFTLITNDQKILSYAKHHDFFQARSL
jgi:PIN domain nuclease of toxin-antitoxin system